MFYFIWNTLLAGRFCIFYVLSLFINFVGFARVEFIFFRCIVSFFLAYELWWCTLYFGEWFLRISVCFWMLATMEKKRCVCKCWWYYALHLCSLFREVNVVLWFRCDDFGPSEFLIFWIIILHGVIDSEFPAASIFKVCITTLKQDVAFFH